MGRYTKYLTVLIGPDLARQPAPHQDAIESTPDLNSLLWFLPFPDHIVMVSKLHASVAQWIEQDPSKVLVGSSNLPWGTIF